jgi:hypothetical protein
MRIWFSLIASVILVASARAACEQVSPVPREEGKFALLIEGGGLGTEVHNRVWFGIERVGASVLWVAERDTDETNWCGETVNRQCKQTRRSGHDRINEKDCPALRQVVSSLPRVQASERGTTHAIVTDTPLVSLVTYRGPGPFMETERLAEYEGLLVNWWQSTEEVLKPCWRA